MFAMAWTELSWPNSGSVNFQSHLKSWARYRSLSDKKYFNNFCFLYQILESVRQINWIEKKLRSSFFGFWQRVQSNVKTPCVDTMSDI